MPKGQRKTRRAQIETLAESVNEEPDYQLPDVGESQYLIEILGEIGEAKWNGEKLISIDWQDLNAWVNVTGSQLTHGEIVAIKHLSGIYLSQHYESIEPGCAAPHLTAPQNRAVIEDKMKSLFAMLRGTKND